MNYPYILGQLSYKRVGAAAYALFCKETEDTFAKLQVAYEWLIFIKNELSIIDKMKSREFIERIKNKVG